MKKQFLTFATLLICSVAAQARSGVCTYMNNQRSYDGNFLTETRVFLNCAGELVTLIGSNVYVGCKPQNTLAKFADQLIPGQKVLLETKLEGVSSIDGSSSQREFVDIALSETYVGLERPTAIHHGKPFQCDSTQVEVH